MDLEAIEQRANSATGGPWELERVGDWHAPMWMIADIIRDPKGDNALDFGTDSALGTFVAAARADVPALVARVRELEAEDQRLRDIAAVTRYVADHWREAAVSNGWAVASHPLCLVLAALNGETEPERLGLDEGDRAALDWARNIAKEE